MTLVHAQLRSVGIVNRLRLAQSILPSCKLHVHAAGHTHGDAVAVPTAATKRVAAHTANVLQRSVFVSDGIFTKRATPRGYGVYVIRKKRDVSRGEQQKGFVLLCACAYYALDDAL